MHRRFAALLRESEYDFLLLLVFSVLVFMFAPSAADFLILVLPLLAAFILLFAVPYLLIFQPSRELPDNVHWVTVAAYYLVGLFLFSTAAYATGEGAGIGVLLAGVLLLFVIRLVKHFGWDAYAQSLLALFIGLPAIWFAIDFAAASTVVVAAGVAIVSSRDYLVSGILGFALDLLFIERIFRLKKHRAHVREHRTE